jgi:hypothetical protein
MLAEGLLRRGLRDNGFKASLVFFWVLQNCGR